MIANKSYYFHNLFNLLYPVDQIRYKPNTKLISFGGRD